MYNINIISRWRTLFLLTFFLSIIGCNYSGKLTRRHKSAKDKPVECSIKQYVSVDASLVDRDPASPPTIRALHDLSPQGQAALIKVLGSKEAASAAFINQLRSDLAVPPDRTLPEIIDFTKMSRRIQVAVAKVPLVDEGARIAKIKIQIKINDPNLRVRNCNRIITEYQNVDLGKLSYSNSNQFELSGNLSVGATGTSSSGETEKNTNSEKNGDNTLGSERTTNNGLSNSGTVSKGIGTKFNASRSMAEEVQLRQRLVALNASIKDNSLILYQEGISGIDLTGNILADLVFEYINDVSVDKVFFLDKLFLPDGVAVPQTNVEVKENYIQAPNITTDITATISFKAVYRKITKRELTITESDDYVDLISGNTEDCSKKDTTVLIPKNALKPNTWYLINGATKLPLSICNGAGMCGILTFQNFKNAVDFLRWLKLGIDNGTINLSNQIGVKGHELKLADNSTVPTSADIKSLFVQLAQ